MKNQFVLQALLFPHFEVLAVFILSKQTKLIIHYRNIEISPQFIQGSEFFTKKKKNNKSELVAGYS